MNRRHPDLGDDELIHIRQQQMAAQAAYRQGPTNKDVVLSSEIENILYQERDEVIASLKKRVDELQAMSALDYLVRMGVVVTSCSNDVLAGRMARKGWESLTWDPHKGSWRIYKMHTESHVQRTEVEEVLNGKREEPSGSEER